MFTLMVGRLILGVSKCCLCPLLAKSQEFQRFLQSADAIVAPYIGTELYL
jgi:hypothetical protein